MLKKILKGLLIVVLVLVAVAAFLYWRYTEANKPPISDRDRAKLNVMPLPAKAIVNRGEFAGIDHVARRIHPECSTVFSLAKQFTLLLISFG